LAGVCAPGDKVQADIQEGEIIFKVIESAQDEDKKVEPVPEPII
jgi:hypothetical protein